jgi:hypothetical protein
VLYALRAAGALPVADAGALDPSDACRAVKVTGEPDAGKPHVRFDEGAWRLTMVGLVRHRQTKEAGTARPDLPSDSQALLYPRASRGCAEDEGRPFEVALQGEAPSHHERLGSKAPVVSVMEKAGAPVRWGLER